MFPTYVSAGGFIENRTAWDKLEPASKANYLMGAADRDLILYTFDDKAEVARKIGTLDCLSAMKMTAPSLVKMVEEGYAADVALWPLPPSVVLYRQWLKVCKADIERERVKFGLPVPDPRLKD